MTLNSAKKPFSKPVTLWQIYYSGVPNSQTRLTICAVTKRFKICDLDTVFMMSTEDAQSQLQCSAVDFIKAYARALTTTTTKAS